MPVCPRALAVVQGQQVDNMYNSTLSGCRVSAMHATADPQVDHSPYVCSREDTTRAASGHRGSRYDA